MYHPFSITETLHIAWHILKKNFATITVYTLTAFVIFVATYFIGDYILIDDILAYTGLIVIMFIISFVFLGFNKLIFQLIDKEYYDFEFRDILPKIKMLFSYIILLVIVSTIAVFVNKAIKNMDDGIIQSLLGVVTGLFIETFFLFYFPICACFIVDEDSGPFESLAQSFNLIKGNFFKYFLLFLIIEAMVLIAYITFLGIIFVVPFVNIVLVVAYRKLVYSHLDVDDDITETV
jgi:hypothetical protein